MALDCLRGLAVLGILLMNMTSYALPGAAYFNPTALGEPSRADWMAWLLTHVLADHRFLQYGPLEWLWCSLTYGARQPFRRAAARAV